MTLAVDQMKTLALSPRDVFANPTPAGLALVALDGAGGTAAFVAPAGPLLQLDETERAELTAGYGPVDDIMPTTPLSAGVAGPQADV